MVWSAVIGAASALLGGRKQSRDNARFSLQERQNALADYDKHRVHALQDYDTQRAHSLQDYHMQRAHALQDYQTQRSDSAYDQATYWQKHRAASETAGFNPLVTMGMTPQAGGQSIAQSAVAQHAIGQSVTAQTTVNPSVMGQSFADAGLLIADGMSRGKEQKLQAEQLRLHNERLNEKLRKATFQPTVGGIYENERSSSPNPILDGGSTNTPLSGGPLADPRREFVVLPNNNSPGTVVIQTPGGNPITLPSIDGSEVMSPVDLAWLGVLAAPQMLHHTFFRRQSYKDMWQDVKDAYNQPFRIDARRKNQQRRALQHQRMLDFGIQ